MNNNDIAAEIPILCYHRMVLDVQKLVFASDLPTFIGARRFDKHMRYISENNYRTISCDEFYDWYMGKIELPKKTVMITFDDAFYDIYYRALPILKKYDVKATVFAVGSNTKETTDPLQYNLSKHYMGLDLMDLIKTTYPKVEFQAHSYALHKKRNEIPIAAEKILDELKEDNNKMKSFGFEYTAHPYGYYDEKTSLAMKESQFKMAFGYDYEQRFASRSDDIYNISRIRIPGDIRMRDFIEILNHF